MGRVLSGSSGPAPGTSDDAGSIRAGALGAGSAWRALGQESSGCHTTSLPSISRIGFVSSMSVSADLDRLHVGHLPLPQRVDTA